MDEPGKRPIPWQAYLIIGIFMSAYSKFVEVKNENSSVAIFFYVGLGFILYGLGKVAFKKFANKESKAIKQEQQRFQQTMQNQHNQNNRAHHNQVHNNQNQKTIIACPRCQARHYSSSNFCHKCGARLR